MSTEHQTRPAPTRGGRGASRGGRGGFGSRPSTRPQRPAAANGDAAKHTDGLASVEDEGEIGQLKKLYGAKTPLIKEMFTDWSEVDILFALRETDGDENLTVTRIAEGTISQWDEVSKPKKERAKQKSAAEAAPGTSARPSRSAAAGAERTRGRARTVERGGRAPGRGRSAQPAAASRPDKTQLSVPTDESRAWDSNHDAHDDTAPSTTAPAPPTHDHEPTYTPSTAPKAPDTSSSAPKTWASMLRQSAAPKPVAKPKEAVAPKLAHESAESEPVPIPAEATAPPEPEPAEDEPEPLIKEEIVIVEVAVPAVAIPDVSLAAPQEPLTESNLERVADTSSPLATETIRSEAADSWDTRTAALAGTGTPVSASAQQHQQASAAKALGSGYATSALKATDRTAVRTPSYSRRVLDQEEAVRMPGNREVDLATVQFGALNFSGGDDDIDGDREEPETRTQPPDDSPTAHPRASLPPVISSAVPDAFAQKPVAAAAAPSLVSGAAPAAAPQQPAAQQYGRFGQESFGQKPFDAYGQPAANAPFESFQNPPASSQAPAQQTPSVYSSAPGDYSQYYTSADAQSRVPFNYYNQAYGQQQHAAQGHQEQNQRSYGGYPLNDSLNQYPQSNASRFGAAAGAAAPVADAQNSGTTTPNPPAPGQPPQAQQAQAGAQNGQGQAQSQQQPQGGQYPYNHPYFSSPYYNQYMNQINQYGGFGGNFAPYGKGGYGNHHPGYGASPQAPYDHNVTPSSAFGGSSLHRGGETSSLASGALGEYGRVGSGQPSSYGSGHDASFGRAASGAYQSQAGQGFGAQPSQAGAQQVGADDLKPYEAKGAAGPSPSMGGARPGSATNSQLTPPSGQQGINSYGGYPSHLQGHGNLHGNQSVTSGYGMGAGANQSHTNNPYGAYGNHGGHGGHGGQGFGGNNYYGNQQRGWGGNYH